MPLLLNKTNFVRMQEAVKAQGHLFFSLKDHVRLIIFYSRQIRVIIIFLCRDYQPKSACTTQNARIFPVKWSCSFGIKYRLLRFDIRSQGLFSIKCKTKLIKIYSFLIGTIKLNSQKQKCTKFIWQARSKSSKGWELKTSP